MNVFNHGSRNRGLVLAKKSETDTCRNYSYLYVENQDQFISFNIDNINPTMQTVNLSMAFIFSNTIQNAPKFIKDFANKYGYELMEVRILHELVEELEEN